MNARIASCLALRIALTALAANSCANAGNVPAKAGSTSAGAPPEKHAHIVHHKKGEKQHVISDSPQAQSYIDQAEELRNNLESERSIRMFTKAIRVDPRNVELYIARAGVYQDLFEYDLAIKDLSRAIALKPALVGTYRHRARILEKLEKNEEAIADYDQAIKLKPDDGSAYQKRAHILKKLKQNDKAIESYKTALKYEHGSAARRESNLALGELYLAVGRYKEAVESFSRAIDLSPDLPQGYDGRSKAYAKLGDRARAEADRIKSQKVLKQYY